MMMMIVNCEKQSQENNIWTSKVQNLAKPFELKCVDKQSKGFLISYFMSKCIVSLLLQWLNCFHIAALVFLSVLFYTVFTMMIK